MDIKEGTNYRIYTVQQLHECLAKLKDSGMELRRSLGVQPVESTLLANVEAFLNQTRPAAINGEHRYQQDEHIVVGQHYYYKDKFVIINDLSSRYYQELLIDQQINVVDYVLDKPKAI